MSPAPTPRHQLAVARLAKLLDVAAPYGLEVVGSVGIDCGRSSLAPDVVVAQATAFDRVAPRLAPEDVRLTVEVVSPSSVRMDRLVKPSVYAEAGIAAFWRVELDQSGGPLVVVGARQGDGYREVVTVRAGEAVVVDVPYPVELRPAELVGPRRREGDAVPAT